MFFKTKKRKNLLRSWLIANEELLFQNQEKERRAHELNLARLGLKKTEGFLREHIAGLEEMLVMTSHGVRQPVGNILGIVNLFNTEVNSPEELKTLMDYLRRSALSLDAFTKKLTIFMCNIGKRHENQFQKLF